ncbi:solute carrier organic anion transporter family member 4C1-like [Mya arenaria]|uniref:solute carrier organic anion transporter family member 4C1-like n=1 Tax=Mya arenaria TaxID=6604 RepID=UPI0022E812C7|nr:solute carrier organic anion transporter family member 4C1-like [Mya arenaria]
MDNIKSSKSKYNVENVLSEEKGKHTGVSTIVDAQNLDVKCGFGRCRPGFLQYFNNAKIMLTVMCFVVFTQGFVVNGVMNVIVSTLERRFQLQSTQVAYTLSAYDFTAAIVGLFVSYFGSGRYKPRLLTMGTVFLLLGSVVLAIPHFTTGRYEWGESDTSICQTGTNETSTALCEPSGLQRYLGVFVLSNVLFGIGGATLYSVGTAYIDDGVSSVSSPFYMGMYFGFAAFGPGIGFVIGGLFLSSYVDVDVVDPEKITLSPLDSRWVGAWWIGPLLSAGMLFVGALAISCFGAELPSAKSVRENRENQLHKGTLDAFEITEPQRPPLKALPKIYLGLFKNPPFLFTTLAGITEGFVLGGVGSFGAKFLQTMFRVSSSRAGIMFGAIAVVGLAGGISFGGFICRCLRLRVAGMLRTSLIVCFLGILCSGVFWMSCGQTNLAGLHSSYLDNAEPFGALQSSCNADCSCTTAKFEVLCYDFNVQYISPCFAGCRIEQDMEYSNCSCVPTKDNGTMSNVAQGSCDSNCPLLYPFLALMLLGIFFTAAADVPAEQAVLRSIHENHKSIMCGTNRFFIRLLGTIPGGVV